MRKNWWLWAAGLALLPAAVLGDTKPDPGAVANGRIIYVRYCVSCHGKAGLGDGPLANDLRVSVPDLTTLAARSQGQYPYERVVRIIGSGEELKGHGTPDMPAWGDAFKRTEGTGTSRVDVAIRNLAHYIGSIQRQPPK